MLRAQQAVEWQQFEAEADVLPNLRWVPSTAVHPGADHQVFWLLMDATKRSNTILPIHHPFWDQHRPGDRWLRTDVTEENNCHCSLEATDEHPTAPPKGYASPGRDQREQLRGLHLDVTEGNNGPQPGLNEHHSDVTVGNNPAKTGRLFAQSHPYFPQTCAQCAFYKPGQGTQFKNAKIDCRECLFLLNCIDKSEPSPTAFTFDKEFGEMLMISECADEKELGQNLRCARAILKAFNDTEIKIRQHMIEEGVKNPEYEINGAIADRKGIEGINGIKASFRSALEQGCSIVVIDLDMHLYNKRISFTKLASNLKGRHKDFISGNIEKCFIVRHDKVALIESDCFLSENERDIKDAILSILLKKIKE